MGFELPFGVMPDFILVAAWATGSGALEWGEACHASPGNAERGKLIMGEDSDAA